MFDSMRKSKVKIMHEFAKTLDSFKDKKFNDQPRFDQSEKPLYPNFEKTKKDDILGQSGWGVHHMKFKSPNPDENIDRSHLKFLDCRLPSNFNGKPSGFNNDSTQTVNLDMSPAMYQMNYPGDARIPLGSLEM